MTKLHRIKCHCVPRFLAERKRALLSPIILAIVITGSLLNAYLISAETEQKAAIADTKTAVEFQKFYDWLYNRGFDNGQLFSYYLRRHGWRFLDLTTTLTLRHFPPEIFKRTYTIDKRPIDKTWPEETIAWLNRYRPPQPLANFLDTLLENSEIRNAFSKAYIAETESQCNSADVQLKKLGFQLFRQRRFGSQAIILTHPAIKDSVIKFSPSPTNCIGRICGKEILNSILCNPARPHCPANYTFRLPQKYLYITPRRLLASDVALPQIILFARRHTGNTLSYTPELGNYVETTLQYKDFTLRNPNNLVQDSHNTVYIIDTEIYFLSSTSSQRDPPGLVCTNRTLQFNNQGNPWKKSYVEDSYVSHYTYQLLKYLYENCRP